MFNCFYCNNSALASDNPDVGTLRDVGRLVGDCFPDVTIDLHTSKAVGLNGLNNPTMTV